jgi:hypothetical protein
MSTLIATDSRGTTYELRFRSMFDPGRGYAFPCDAAGCVELDALSEHARNNYLYARALVGRDLAVPQVQLLGCFDIQIAPREAPDSAQSRRKTKLGLGPSEALQRRVGAVWGLILRTGVPKGARPRCASCLGPYPRRRGTPCLAPLATPARGDLNVNTP